FTPAELRDRREAAYVAWVSTLLPLRGREFTLTLAGEETVGDRPAVGVRVSSEAHRDVTLFFDKGTRLLVKTETRSMAGTGVEGKVETYLRLHKDVRGVKRPMMMMTWHDGRSLISHWVREYRLAEAPVEGTFAKP